MKYFGDELGGLHKEMGSIIRKKGRFEEARLMFFRLHSQLHSGSVYGLGETEYDCLLSGLNDDDFRLRPQKDAAGIILMPLTRHQLLHLNQCGKIKSELTHQSKK